MTSYQLSERINPQVILWALALPIYRAGCAIGNAYQALVAMLPALLYWLGILAKALALVALVAGLVAVVAMIPVTFWAGMIIVGAFGWATYPRTAVK